MNRGYSLIELALALVIAAIIISAVLVGKTLIRNSEIHAVMGEVNDFRRAFQVFFLKYGAKPGDINRANHFWPGVGNGNGNGSYENGTDYFSEGYLAWQHLGLAELIQGRYTGAKLSRNRAKLNINVPASQLSGGGYSLMYDNRMNSSYAPLKKDMIRFGSEHPTWNTSYAIISPIEARQIDDKIDDGQPDNGIAYTDNGLDQERHACSNGLTYPNTEYATSEKRLCMMQFLVD